MNVLVLGGGGREHALAVALRRAPSVDRVYCAPGNPGIARDTTPCRVEPRDVGALARFVEEHAIELVVPGPESLIADGTADALRQTGARVFAPSREAARVESSKIFGAALRERAGLPAPQCFVPEDLDEAQQMAEALIEASGGVAVKADGLCAGKGVVVASDVTTAHAALAEMMSARRFGEAGARVVLEARLVGEELSLLAVCDGTNARLLPAAQDYKRLFDGNRGPNTGGMGALSPAPGAHRALLDAAQAHIFVPTLAALRDMGTPYVGVLYAGLLCDANDGGTPKVLEFNARFGDPETQAVLPLLRSDLARLFVAACDGKLAAEAPLEVHAQSAVCVVLASAGYPDAPRVGARIDGLERAAAAGAMVFHAGTRAEGDAVVTAGGRVLGVTALGASLREAADRAHAAADEIRFDGVQRRRDIGRASNRVEPEGPAAALGLA